MMNQYPSPSMSSASQPQRRRPFRVVTGLMALVLSATLIFSAGFVAGGAFQTTMPEPSPALAAETDPVPEPIREAWNLIQERYVDTEAIDDQALIQGAITGMLETLGDEGHTRYLTPEQVAQHRQGLAGSIVGIGIQVEIRDGDIVVVTPLDGSPAERAGVRAGDVLVRVDGQDVRGQPLEHVVSMVRGEEGTTVNVTFFRPSENRRIDLTLQRARIDVRSVTWALLDDGIGVIRIRQFANNTTSQLVAAIEELRAAGAEGIVLDLRNNPGGYVHEAIGVASQLLPEGSPVFISRGRDRVEEVHRTESGLAETDLPLVVLINQGSASASEIVAGALRENGRAVLVGETTFGTGTVLNQFGLSDGSAILLGTQLWLTPEGRQIRGQGISPDQRVVLMPDDELFLVRGAGRERLTLEQIETDPQLRRAVGVLRGEPAPRAPTGRGCLNCR